MMRNSRRKILIIGMPAILLILLAVTVIPVSAGTCENECCYCCECGCGCTLTLGYWKTHSSYGPAPYDPTWNGQEDWTFWKSGMTIYQVLWEKPSGNPYYILAHQYIAAKLNTQNGASAPPEVSAALTWAYTFFSTYSPADSLSKSERQAVIYYANILDQYNEGYIGPGHCPE